MSSRDGWGVFPKTYFGFTNKARFFNRHQAAALCKIDEIRLLFESDAQYLPIVESTVSSPSQPYVLTEMIDAHLQLVKGLVRWMSIFFNRHGRKIPLIPGGIISI